MDKQAYNPFLPLDVCIPDGEPHVFGERVYLFGSHDKEGGDAFCMLDYEGFSAPVTDLSDWRSEGVIYRAEQDPDYSDEYKYMYAPDAVRGNDGRYYLYYAMAGGVFTGPIKCAVCDTPAGKYSYHGCVRNPDGSPYIRHITFDPGVINDDGTIRLYYGWSLTADKEMIQAAGEGFQAKLLEAQSMMFRKTKEEILAEPYGIMGANVVTLADDMLTVVTEPKRIVHGQFDANGSSFEGHAFFEASSIRKIGDTYYFIYSSELNHELCYAVSRYPDRGFIFGGTIISNGDVGYHGRKESDRLCATGNNHGSIERINGQWYVFYHRQTHKTMYSRQACAEPIEIKADGSIQQVEMTSCGLNGGPLKADGVYPAPICCNLTNGCMPHMITSGSDAPIPYITHDTEYRFIADISDGTLIGYKYFDFKGGVDVHVTYRGNGQGALIVMTDDGNPQSTIEIQPSGAWIKSASTHIEASATRPLYFQYAGTGTVDLLEICLEGGSSL